jgi:hypothetical protein
MTTKFDNVAKSGVFLRPQIREIVGRVHMSKKRSKHRSRQVAGVLGTTSVLCLSQLVRAELPGAQLDEVIVTATKRETNLQETPVAITAF